MRRLGPLRSLRPISAAATRAGGRYVPRIEPGAKKPDFAFIPMDFLYFLFVFYFDIFKSWKKSNLTLNYFNQFRQLLRYD